MKSPATKHFLVPLCLVAALAGLCFAAWSWRQVTRPGLVHFERGLDYAAAKRMPQAEQEWLTGVREDSEFADNHTQLGDLYSALGRFGEAAAQYQAATRLTPKDGALFLRLARADEAAGDTKAALAAADHAAALRPDDAETLDDYGILAAKLNRPKTARAPLARAYALAPDNADILIYLVRVEFQLQDLAGAERDLTPFVKRHPDNAEACYLMASLLNQKPLTPDTLHTALDYARRAHAGAPGNAEASTLLGQLFLDAGNPTAALTVFRQAQAAEPHSPTVLHGLLNCYIRLHQTALAGRASADLSAEAARRARIARIADRLTTDPADTTAALAMARFREENNELPLALGYYQQAVHHAPQDSRARTALADFLRRTGRQKP